MATRTQIEAELVALCRGPLLQSDTAADPINDASPRTYLNAAIRAGLLALGVEPVDPFAVVDADLSGVGISELPQLIAVAEVATLELCLLNLTPASTGVGVDVRSRDLEHKLSQYADRLKALIAEKRTRLETVYGIGGSVPEAGVWDLNFQQGCADGGEFA